jgi:hypothetical protein
MVLDRTCSTAAVERKAQLFVQLVRRKQWVK